MTTTVPKGASTPRPWVVAQTTMGPCIETEHEEPVIFAVGFAGRPSIRNANAALIVRAVNCHDELVDALERLADGLSDDHDALQMVHADDVRRARAILAKGR